MIRICTPANPLCLVITPPAHHVSFGWLPRGASRQPLALSTLTSVLRLLGRSLVPQAEG